MSDQRSTAKLLAISDLHVSHPENRRIVAGLRPTGEGDWLLLAGDVGELMADIRWALSTLRSRFHTVVWAPGNHELWTHPSDPVQLRGVARYEALVGLCRELGVVTPEDPYPVFEGIGGPVTVAPLFLLYDYSFLAAGLASKERALAYAYESGIVCNDEFMLHPDPYPSREAWCRHRLDLTERRLAARERPELPTILVNHFPMVRQVTDILRWPHFAMWCGTDRTADWHLRFNATAVVYGHLHIPRVTWHDGVRFEEVSLGYPREWRRPGWRSTGLRHVLAAGIDSRVG
ncbi:metallophosphoesterase [Micromonospora sp. WMMD1082]|uniref:metallophosphoesterase family protein n=1 Tax=Micromonospora sp. WMMD1082 TaxID=3016104 RepID=UPI002416574E|nr:metallophosphoesterase [Micromonospora sp. WMMD1082]MDG4794577.1 metallophosphoesterase [Micromonospora sp. WMMD1082]